MVSRNITVIEYLSGKLMILRSTVNELRGAIDPHDVPEAAFFLPDEETFCLKEVKGTEDHGHLLEIKRFGWYGDYSGSSYNILRGALSHTIGMADILIVWEEGEKHTGLRVKNGRVVEMGVGFYLVPEGGKEG